MSHATVEEGLRRFCDLCEKSGAQIMNFRTESVLNQNVALRIINGSSYILRLRKDSAELISGEDLAANATVTMSEEDWLGVLSAEYNIDGVALAGRCPYPRHERRLIRQLGSIIQTTLLLEGGQ